MTSPGHPAPTWVRWRILALLMALCFISHLNRLAMSVAGTERLIPEFGITPARMGLVYTAFLACYTAGMILGGWCIDRLGPRVMLLVMGFGSAVFGALTGGLGYGLVGAANFLAGLIVVRGLMGFFTTPLHPACARAVSHWMPPHQISWANGLVTFAAVLGMASASPVFGSLMDGLGWPAAFLVLAGALFALTVLWAILGRDHVELRPPTFDAQTGHEPTLPIARSPDTFAPIGGEGWAEGEAPVQGKEHPPANVAERELIRDPSRPFSPEPVAAAEVPAPLWSRSLILLTLSYAAVGYFQYLFFYWSEYYFKDVMHLSIPQSRANTTFLILALGVGMPVGGWLADRAQRRHRGRLGWALVPGIAMVLSAAFLFLGLVAREPRWIVLLFALAMFALGASESTFWQAAVELGDRRGGTAAAIINTGGNGIGLLAPLLTPLISAQLGWQWGIAMGGIVGLLGAFCWFGIHPPRRAC